MLAMIFMILPLPRSFSWLRPHWLTLVLIYWIVFSPNLIGVASGFAAGIFLDLLGGVLLGSTGLVLAVIAFLATVLRPRIRQIRFWQQLVIVIFLVGFEQLIYLWLQLFLGLPSVEVGYWYATGLSIIAWPILFSLLQTYQRKLKLL